MLAEKEVNLEILYAPRFSPSFTMLEQRRNSFLICIFLSYIIFILVFNIFSTTKKTKMVIILSTESCAAAVMNKISYSRMLL